MEKDRLDQYIKALKAKGADTPCSRCGHKHFDISGEAIVSIQENPNVVKIGGPRALVVLVVCSRCGYIAMHSQDHLNMLR